MRLSEQGSVHPVTFSPAWLFYGCLCAWVPGNGAGGAAVGVESRGPRTAPGINRTRVAEQNTVRES